MTQTILSVPIRPPREFVKCCVPTVRYLSSKLYTGVGNLSFMNLFFSSTFILKKSTTFKKCISRSFKIDVESQDILSNQNVMGEGGREKAKRERANLLSPTPLGREEHPIVKKIA